MKNYGRKNHTIWQTFVLKNPQKIIQLHIYFATFLAAKKTETRNFLEREESCKFAKHVCRERPAGRIDRLARLSLLPQADHRATTTTTAALQISQFAKQNIENAQRESLRGGAGVGARDWMAGVKILNQSISMLLRHCYSAFANF